MRMRSVRRSLARLLLASAESALRQDHFLERFVFPAS